MIEQETCECCGQKVRTPNTHNLTKGLVDSLIMFANQLEKTGKNRLHLLKETGWNTNRINNFQKLRYFGLVAKSEENGEWVLTTRGKDFLNGDYRSPVQVATFNNRTIDHSSEEVSFKDAKKSEVYWQTEFNIQIKQGTLI